MADLLSSPPPSPTPHVDVDKENSPSPAAASRALGKRKAQPDGDAANDEREDKVLRGPAEHGIEDDLEVCGPPAPLLQQKVCSAADCEADDDEVVYEGRTGDLAYASSALARLRHGLAHPQSGCARTRSISKWWSTC